MPRNAEVLYPSDVQTAHLLIVDGHHLLYRAYWAIPRTMKTSKGEQVNTTFGIASMLLLMLKIEKPDKVLFCFDADEETFRHEEYGEYKAGRTETPDDFYTQIPRALELIERFRIKSVSGNKFEADDYACSYALAASQAGHRVTIVTGDRDLLQLASDKVRIAIPHKGYQAAEYMTPETVLRKYGVTPAQIPSYKGLVGDPSDNLPGVHGIGPKAASALLQEFGSVKGIYDAIDKVKPSWREKLIAGREQAEFCERMATLTCDIPLALPLDTLDFSGVATAPILELFQELEFTLPRKRLVELLSTEWGNTHFVQGENAPLRHVPRETETPSQLSLL